MYTSQRSKERGVCTHRRTSSLLYLKHLKNLMWRILSLKYQQRQKARSDNSQGSAHRPLYTFRDVEVHRQPEKCKFKSVRFISHTPDWVKIQMLNYILSVGKLEQAPISGGM